MGDNTLLSWARGLHPHELREWFMSATWYAQPDDLVGGWCVMPVPFPPSSGFFSVAEFMDQATAQYVAGLHNDKLNQKVARFK